MAKLSTYIMVTVGLMLLMSIAGLNTSMSWVVGQLGLTLGNVQNFSTGPLYAAIIAAIVLLVTVSGIRIGIFGTSTPGIYATAVAAGPFALLVGDLVSIIIQINSGGPSWASYVAFLVLVPFMVGYMITLLDWVKGTA